VRPFLISEKEINEMSSAAQLVANRANAQLSTGPKTEAGKQASSRNAVRHGFTAIRLTVAPQDQADFNTLKQNLLLDVRPEGALEDSLFERLLLANWNLRRITRYEAELLDQTNPFAPGDPEAAQAFDRLARYRRDLERSAKLALAELRKLQTERAILLQQHETVAAPLINTTPLAELSRLTGETDPLISRGACYRVPFTFHNSRQAASEAAQKLRRPATPAASAA
jgi:hypothetical protein